MQRIYNEYRLRVNVEWERGKGSLHAKAVDKLAKQSSTSASFGRARPTNVRRKLTTASVEPGSVHVEGQRLRIHIIDARHLSRNEARYRYEVVDPSSPYNTKVDFAESDLPLAPGHTYDVRMGTDQANPRIAELLAEVEEDLTKYRDALRVLGRPASATDVSAEIARATGVTLGPQAVKWRLEKLVNDAGEARRTSATSGRKRFLYELVPSDQEAGSA
jgi:hypothetical protein